MFQDYAEKSTKLAAEAIRRAALPQNEADYKTDLPKDFVVPQGIEVKFNEADPQMVAARKFAKDNSLSQEQFSGMLAVHAAARVAETQLVETAKTAELAKMGAAGPSRVTEIQTFLKGHLGDDLGGKVAGMLVTADIVKGFESLISKFTSQGGASFSQSHRVPPDDKSIPGYDNMSFEQRRFAQDQRAQRRTA